MTPWHADLPPYERTEGSRLILVQSPAGTARAQALEAWREQARKTGTAVHFLSCDFRLAGPWAGLKDLLERAHTELETRDPQLIARHVDELSLVLPSLSERLAAARPTLTDLAVPEERVRNYPMDRAYRIVQGLVDLIADWHRGDAAPSRIIVCDRYEQAGALVRRFFRELMRRRSEALDLTLVLVTEPADSPAEEPHGSLPTTYVRLAVPAGPEESPDPAAMSRSADELEARVQRTDWEFREYLSSLIHCLQHSENPQRALFWQARAFGQYNHYGFYEDALRHGAVVRDHLDEILSSTSFYTRWNLVGALGNCYLAVGQPEQALEIVENEGLRKIEDPGERVKVFYVLALIHSRFLPRPDFAVAESYVQQGLESLEKSALPESERLFLQVFTLNGLAYIRHRQGRPEEALELCRSGFELLEEKLGPDQHRLHRSVLLYNTAQVYGALRAFEKAIEYYSRAMELDPNYSEYYNERGNAYLSLFRPEEAIQDYRAAIRLSAPYQEVWTNLGQAYKLMQRMDDAADAYAQALDYDPTALLAWLGRAQALDALGRSAEALAAYSRALDLDPAQPLALANRAALLYDAGRTAEALRDLDEAVRLAPGDAGLRLNRAMALESLERRQDAAADLRAIAELTPDADLGLEAEARLAHLAACEQQGMTVTAE